MKGQFLERPTLVPVAENLVLEGLWHRGTHEPPVLVIPPPPGQGGMDHVLAAEIAWSCAQVGHAELRFNFRGVGASQGKSSSDALDDDARAALTLVQENTNARGIAVMALGDSAGLALRLNQMDDRVTAVALIHPKNVDLEVLSHVTAPLLVILEDAETADRAAMSQAIHQARGRLEFTPHLHEIGRLVQHWLTVISARSA